MVDKLEAMLTRLIVDDMERQARVSRSEVRYDVECGVMDFDGAFRPCEIAHRIAAALPTPTQDTRDRVKVLEEALRNLLDFIGPKDMRVYATDLVVVEARTALGNKETDRG